MNKFGHDDRILLYCCVVCALFCRDRYGISQLIFDEERTSKEILKNAKSLGREFVIQITGEVIERSSKNSNIKTGEIEILVSNLTVLNESKVPPFTIEENTD